MDLSKLGNALSLSSSAGFSHGFLHEDRMIQAAIADARWHQSAAAVVARETAARRLASMYREFDTNATAARRALDARQLQSATSRALAPPPLAWVVQDVVSRYTATRGLVAETASSSAADAVAKHIKTLNSRSYVESLPASAAAGLRGSSLAELVGKYGSVHSVAFEFTKRRSEWLERSHSVAAARGIPTDLEQAVARLAGELAISRAVATAQRWPDPSAEIRRALLRFTVPLDRSSTRDILDAFASRAREAGVFDQAEIGPDVDDLLQGQALAATQEIVARIATQPSGEEALSSILTAISKIPDTRLQRILWFGLLPLFFLLLNSVVAPVADYQIKKWLESRKQPGTPKEIRQAATAAVGDLHLLHEHRFVVAKTLHVRMNASSRAPLIGQLQYGQVVRVLDARGNFTLISWTSGEGSAVVQGWVFSRYVRRFEQR